MIVKLVKNISEEDRFIIKDLKIGKDYEVIGIEADDYRIICDTDKEPYLYPFDCFKIVDDTKPSFWVTEFGEDGEEYSCPIKWNQVGFFEDYFDEVKEVKEQFWADYKKFYNNNSN
ncbi:hypothetical protein [Desulfogranum japonicum]|uniref:hypothetical protein n=1 Tax=Desulfogranum japonicum TaxID=231447 RepID=UPI0003FC4ACF|nr:hypothetical protein [Desulfogranum japonicum]